MAKKETIRSLMEKGLQDFNIIEMTEVFATNNDGRKSTSLGFFKDPNIAEAFSGTKKSSHHADTSNALVLTDGTVGFVIKEQESIEIRDDEKELLEVKKQALAKLTPAERRLFGFE